MLISTDVVMGPNTPYAKEITKHEANYTQYGPPGRPYVFREYPSALYRAKRTPQGGDPAFEMVEVGNEQERESAERRGFVHGGKAAALSALETQEFEYAELAANRHFSDRKLSEPAQAEVAAVDAGTIQHLPSIPEQPIKRRGRKPKASAQS